MRIVDYHMYTSTYLLEYDFKTNFRTILEIVIRKAIGKEFQKLFFPEN